MVLLLLLPHSTQIYIPNLKRLIFHCGLEFNHCSRKLRDSLEIVGGDEEDKKLLNLSELSVLDFSILEKENIKELDVLVELL